MRKSPAAADAEQRTLKAQVHRQQKKQKQSRNSHPSNANAVVVRRRGRPRKIPMDDVSSADKNMSQATKCIHQEEHQDDDGKEDRETGRLLKGDGTGGK